MNFEQEFNKKFGERFSNLYLKNVVVDKDTCTVTFLYPSADETLTDEEKEEIIKFAEEKLSLSYLHLKVKFLKVYVEEKLIRKALFNILEDKFKLLKTYIHDEDIKVEITNIDCTITFDVSPRLAQFLPTTRLRCILQRH